MRSGPASSDRGLSQKGLLLRSDSARGGSISQSGRRGVGRLPVACWVCQALRAAALCRTARSAIGDCGAGRAGGSLDVLRVGARVRGCIRVAAERVRRARRIRGGAQPPDATARPVRFPTWPSSVQPAGRFVRGRLQRQGTAPYWLVRSGARHGIAASGCWWLRPAWCVVVLPPAAVRVVKGHDWGDLGRIGSGWQGGVHARR